MLFVSVGTVDHRLEKQGSSSHRAHSNVQCLLASVSGCDLSFPSNKLVSGDHCKLTVDKKSGQVTLEDTR